VEILMSIQQTTDKLHNTELLFVTRVRLRAQRRMLWLHHLWGRSFADNEQVLAISHTEVERILAGAERDTDAESLFYKQEHAAQQLGKEIRIVEQKFENDEQWRQLRRTFALTEPDIDLLCIAIAAEVDPSLRRVYGYLQDDINASHATPWLASCLFQWSPGERVGPDSALVRWRMAGPIEGQTPPWTVNAPWVADLYMVLWLTHASTSTIDPALESAVSFMALPEKRALFCLYPALLTTMLSFVSALQKQPVCIELELVGPAGVGKRTLAAQLCTTLATNLLFADAELLLGADLPFAVQVEKVIHTVRMARLANAALYWDMPAGLEHRAWQLVQERVPLTIIGTAGPLPQRYEQGVVRKSFHLPQLRRSMRASLWRHLCALPIPDQVLDWLLTPAEIAQAVQVAPAGTTAVIEACRQALYQGPGELFTILPCPFTWDDIILAPRVRQHLSELEQQARLRGPVYEEWGFERLLALGRGVTALFAGPSGTGKTMAAQVLAHSLDMDLYRVDLAGVMSKYIGETEKRLKQIFDTCERANVLLFFDEADALFGQRTQVKDAHDRFANIEIDYLLQRMEQFNGVAILATNRKGELDSAFLRRLRFIVDFMEPGVAERRKLWHIALPTHAPNGEELRGQIDWEFLATKLSMTGAEIKSTALGAAFLARSEGQGTRISMKHILHSAQRELAKQDGTPPLDNWKE